MSPLDRVFEAERSFLWGLAYRLTGSAADADDVVQAAFLRALERPPPRTDLPWRPWLVRVTTNLGRDLLRRRRRRPYEGSWLPSPIETSAEPPSVEPGDPAPDPLARYTLLESVSLAFLLALEALTPTQRAALLLRDVLDYSTREAAAALAISEPALRQAHRRARRRMASYEAERASPPQQRVREALERFLAALGSGDAAAIEALLAPEARVVSDGGGEFHSARRPIVGRARVARFFLGLASRARRPPSISPRLLNGAPAVLVGLPESGPGYAPRVALLAQLDAEGRIAELFVVLATAKLSHVS